MAYSKTPTQDTYQTKRVGLLSNPLQRDDSNSKDAKFVNCLIDQVVSKAGDGKKFYVKSRPGLDSVYSVAAGTARGSHYWIFNNVGYLFQVVDNKVYVNGVSQLTLTTSTGYVGFCEFLDVANNAVKLILLDGTKGYVWTNTTTNAEIVDVDFPTPHVPMPIYLDGYLFVAKANTADIYNSDLNDPMTWPTGEFISAEMSADTIVALTKNNNYIYGVGTQTVEFFYDAANSTGTPLSRNASALMQFGSPAPYATVQTDKEVIMVGQSGAGGQSVWVISDFKETDISIPMVIDALRDEGSSLATATASCLRVSGQKLYVLFLATRTLVYSFSTQMWSEWDSGANGGTPFIAEFGSDGPDGSCYLLDKTSGDAYLCGDEFFNDNGTAFQVEIVTQKLDFDSINRKFMGRFSIVGDVPNVSNNNVSVSWSDDDYTTWSAVRTLYLNGDFPAILQLGVFRRRAFKIQYNLPYLFRIEGIEVDLNMGSS